MVCLSYAMDDKKIGLFQNKNFNHLAIPTSHTFFIQC